MSQESSLNIKLAAAYYRAVQAGNVFPPGTRAGKGSRRWYPRNKLPCCERVPPPTEAEPLTLYHHQATVEHIAAMFGVAVPALIAELELGAPAPLAPGEYSVPPDSVYAFPRLDSLVPSTPPPAAGPPDQETNREKLRKLADLAARGRVSEDEARKMLGMQEADQERLREDYEREQKRREQLKEREKQASLEYWFAQARKETP